LRNSIDDSLVWSSSRVAPRSVIVATAVSLGSHRKHNIASAAEAASALRDIVTGDVPYLVDSLRAELERRSCPAERVLHPQIVVQRDADGRLSKVLDIDDNAPVPEDAIVESWMHIELDDIPADQHDVLARDLRNVLDDVHHAVEDAPTMYRRMRMLAHDLTEDPGEFDRETSEEAGELLRWLADGNYMILGHAAFSANELASPKARNDDEDAEFAITPRPGRLVIARGALLHRGNVPVRGCYEERYTLAYKLNSAGPSPA